MADPRKRVTKGRQLTEGGRVDKTQTEQGHRQDDQAARQKRQGATQVTQGHTQDDQGVTQLAQGVTQDAQGVTQKSQGRKQEAQGITQDVQAATQAEQANLIAANSMHILAISDGVGILATQVEQLNTNVYTKNYLDRVRNKLFAGTTATLVICVIVFGILLWRINDTANIEAVRSSDRAAEAVQARRQLADCQVPPGVVLEDGFVNPGKCYTETGERAQKYIDDAINNIRMDMKEVVAGLAQILAQNLSLSNAQRMAAAQEAARLRAPVNVPVVVQAPPVTTIPPAPTPKAITPPTSTPPRTGVDALVCSLISIIGGCT